MKINFSELTGKYENCGFDLKPIFITEEKLQKIIAIGLRIARKNKKLSVQKVLKTTEIPTNTIYRYEYGENIPSSLMLFKLCSCYEIKTSTLLLYGYNELQEK